MTDLRRYKISDAGMLVLDEAGPRSWDGEPVWSVETVQEGLFDPSYLPADAGQLVLEEDGDHD